MQFAIIAKDGTDAEALARRMKARPDHIALAKQHFQDGKNILGGAMLNDDGDMCGSIMIVDFPDRAAVEAWVQSDPYITGNVWKDIQIVPFKVAGVKVPKTQQDS